MTVALEVRDVGVTYGGLAALAGVSVRFEPGAITGIIGANGSGKTTLLDVISGQIEPDCGQVLFDGLDLALHLPEDRAAIGLVRSFQDCRLFPELSVLETLLVNEDARVPASVLATALGLPRARRAERAKRARIDGLLTSFGLDPFGHNLVSELSTGTRRVLDLATIVAAAPRVLLLDEPTAGIAQREAEAFGPLLRRMHAMTGATTVLVEHDVPLTFSLCDQILVMEAGSVVSSGTPAEVMTDPVAVEAYLGASREALARSGAYARPRRVGRQTSPEG